LSQKPVFKEKKILYEGLLSLVKMMQMTTMTVVVMMVTEMMKRKMMG
jgi:hypothetical protein